MSVPSLGNSMSAGHLFVHALQPFMQFSLSLVKENIGNIGNIENTAPIGQRNLQKNLSQTAIPIIINNKIIIAGTYAAKLIFPEISIEKTSHGLHPLVLEYTPKKHAKTIAVKIIYFK